MLRLGLAHYNNVQLGLLFIQIGVAAQGDDSGAGEFTGRRDHCGEILARKFQTREPGC